MIIYPAMDLMGGRCVRLLQGRFDEATTYPANPRDALLAFAAAGAEWAHLVDLDGARAGEPRQHELLGELARSAPIKLQVAGGFRTADQIANLLLAGVERVVIGSLAVADPVLVNRLLLDFGGERITLALDVRIVDGVPLVATSGWAETSTASLWEIAGHYDDARHLLVTDIGRDGMLSGPNFELLDEAVRRLPHLSIQASGGVSSLGDLERLRSAGTSGAIVGKALWEQRIDLEEAISRARA